MARYLSSWDFGLTVTGEAGVLDLDDALWLMRRGFALWLEFRQQRSRTTHIRPVALIRYSEDEVDLSGQWVRQVDEYDKTWRLWNRRPTEKRMREEEWL